MPTVGDPRDEDASGVDAVLSYRTVDDRGREPHVVDAEASRCAATPSGVPGTSEPFREGHGEPPRRTVGRQPGGGGEAFGRLESAVQGDDERHRRASGQGSPALTSLHPGERDSSHRMSAVTSEGYRVDETGCRSAIDPERTACFDAATQITTDQERREGIVAEVHILSEGYIHESETELRVGSTVSLIVDGDTRVVVDPGFVPSVASILDPLAALGVGPGDVTDVVLSHHHPDHTVHVALFPAADVHDHMATYRGDRWIDRPAEGFRISDGVSLIETPGHTLQDITTLVSTGEGVVAFTHLWWSADGPADDPYAPDRELLRANRERVLELATLVVPGHGPRFRPTVDTPT